MLRILQINTSDMRGGAETVARSLHDTYRGMGHASWLAVGHKQSRDHTVLPIPELAGSGLWGRAWHRFERTSSSLDSKVRGLGKLGVRLRTAAQPQHFLAWSQGIEDFEFPGTWRVLELPPGRPDIVHLHNLHGNYFDLRALPWLSRNVPVVMTLHDAWLLSGHCGHSFECERWRTGCGQCPDLTIYPPARRDATAWNWRRKREIYSKTELCVATPSRWLMQKVEQSILANAITDARVIPNGVNLSIFRPAPKEDVRSTIGIPADALMLLFAANGIRPNAFKDFATIRAALATLAPRMGNERLLFVALGEEAPAEYIDGVQVRFVPYEEDPFVVARYYQAADVYVHAARADNFPLTILEALASGVPVVATAVGGIPEQVENGRTGFLVPPSDPSSMAESIETLLRDEGLRRKFGTRAAEDATQRFALSRQADEYIRWYQRILST